jgi:hypothetical protein
MTAAGAIAATATTAATPTLPLGLRLVNGTTAASANAVAMLLPLLLLP